MQIKRCFSTGINQALTGADSQVGMVVSTKFGKNWVQEAVKNKDSVALKIQELLYGKVVAVKVEPSAPPLELN